MHFDSKHILAAVSYILFFVPLMTSSKRDPLVSYHIKQGIGFFVFAAALRGILTALGGPPYTALGSALASSWLLLQATHLVLIVLIASGVYSALQGKIQPLPVIGKYFESW